MAREYQREYPERYIRISDESWRYDSASGRAFHSFKLRSMTTVVYDKIRVRLVYRAPDGKVRATREAGVPGVLKPGATREVSDLEVRGVPPDGESANVSVAGAESVR